MWRTPGHGASELELAEGTQGTAGEPWNKAFGRCFTRLARLSFGNPNNPESWLAKIRRERRAKTFADYLCYSQSTSFRSSANTSWRNCDRKSSATGCNDGYSESTVAHMHRVLRS